MYYISFLVFVCGVRLLPSNFCICSNTVSLISMDALDLYQAFPPLFYWEGQRSYTQLLCGTMESLGTKLAAYRFGVSRGVHLHLTHTSSLWACIIFPANLSIWGPKIRQIQLVN